MADIQALIDVEVRRISEIADPVEREAEARALGAVVEQHRAELRRVRTRSLRSLNDPAVGGMSYRTASVVLGMSHAHAHRLATADA